MRLISDRVYSAWLTAKVLLYQKMTFIFRELITFLNLPIPFLPRPHFPVHSPSLCPVWFPSKPSHRCPVNIFKMLPECVALLLNRNTYIARPHSSHPLQLLAVLTILLERGPLKFDYNEPNPSLFSPACSANPLKAGCAL